MKNKGFTLTELIVTVGIIVVLSGTIFVNLGSSRLKARDSERISDTSQLQLAVQLYYDRCGQFPAASSGALSISANNGCPSGVTLGSFISQIPTPPAGGGQTAYDYATLTASGVVVNYVIHTVLEQYNVAVSKGLASMPSGYSSSYTCSNGGSSTNYCVTSN